jgi:hypothetical protein
MWHQNYNLHRVSKISGTTLDIINEDIEPPESFNWRDHGAVTPIKIQLRCGAVTPIRNQLRCGKSLKILLFFLILLLLLLLILINFYRFLLGFRNYRCRRKPLANSTSQ